MLTPQQKRILVVAAIVVAFTRWWASSMSIWDSDEARFSAAVRAYDVTRHHPHPPGFPVYIFLGKVLNPLCPEPFRALQLVNLLSASLLFPATVFFLLQMGFGFPVAFSGGILTVFVPPVWFFGGTAFSDVPSLTVIVFASALLLYSRNAPSAWLIFGAIAYGLAAGVRVQNLLVGLLPFGLSLWARLRARHFAVAIAAVAVLVLTVTASYTGAAAVSSSWDGYLRAVETHRAGIVMTDSFRSRGRPPLHLLVDDFFLRPFQLPVVGAAVIVLAAFSLMFAIVRRAPAPVMLLLTFGPLAVMSWLTLDYQSASRFSVGYVLVLTALAADGIESLTSLLFRARFVRVVIRCAVVGTIVGVLIIWTIPALREARTTLSPPAAAVRWIRMNLQPGTTRLYVAESLKPIAEYALSDYQVDWVQDERTVEASPATSTYLLAEGATNEPNSVNFLRPRTGRLWRIARQRFFEVHLVPLHRRPRFLTGWYAAENSGAESWRWMGRRSVTILPPQDAPARLRLTFRVPLNVVPAPNITIKLNGMVIDRFRATAAAQNRTYLIARPHSDQPNLLELETDQSVNPKKRRLSEDDRDLGLMFRSLRWGPAS